MLETTYKYPWWETELEMIDSLNIHKLNSNGGDGAVALKGEKMTRSEHLQWCKDRAMEYVNRGDLSQAFASFSSDMSKHPETANHSALQLGVMLLFGGHLDTESEMRKWIKGFN